MSGHVQRARFDTEDTFGRVGRIRAHLWLFIARHPAGEAPASSEARIDVSVVDSIARAVIVSHGAAAPRARRNPSRGRRHHR